MRKQKQKDKENCNLLSYIDIQLCIDQVNEQCAKDEDEGKITTITCFFFLYKVSINKSKSFFFLIYRSAIAEALKKLNEAIKCNNAIQIMKALKQIIAAKLNETDLS